MEIKQTDIQIQIINGFVWYLTLKISSPFIKFITINLSVNADVIISASLVSIFGSLYILTSGNIDTELLLLTISKFATRDL
mgnify:CR=1 FL=1